MSPLAEPNLIKPRRLGRWSAGFGATLLSAAAQAVNDLPGGPKVNQLDLQTLVTGIAAQQMWLHDFMLVVCLLIFLAVFGVMTGFDSVAKKTVGERLVSYTYVSLGKEFPLRWRFYFYKPQESWKLIDLRVDDRLSAMFDEPEAAPAARDTHRLAHALVVGSRRAYRGTGRGRHARRRDTGLRRRRL